MKGPKPKVAKGRLFVDAETVLVTGMFQNVGRALIFLREQTGKSQAALARSARIGKSQLSKYENGKELPKLESLERVLAALGTGYFAFFCVLDVVDRDEVHRTRVVLPEINATFAQLTHDLFALHSEIVKEIPR